ncbi:ABC transporter ATPase [Clostridium sp. UBA1056]|uniref:ABC transporter ATPase n=1 Tax=unclassified Clostridium TaxID=2614128 RepID=UPI0032171203
MRELNTIQKKEKLNKVFAVDEVGPGGANHRYIVCKHEETSWCNGNNSEGVYEDIQFQCGPRKEENSKHGLIDSDLLEIVRDRLKAFQAGPFASEYNEHALKHIEEALYCMNARVEDRIKRNVLGRNEK